MKVLVLGATGNLGLRLVPALLTHDLEVVAFVRSASKLRSLLPQRVISRIEVVEGDLLSSDATKDAILSHHCDALINVAGVAAVFPGQKTNFPAMFAAVLRGAIDAQEKRGGPPMRCWMLGGMGALSVPEKPNTTFSDWILVFHEHGPNFKVLQEVPQETLRWSMLCPSQMIPASSDFGVPTATARARLVAQANTPPGWTDRWVKHLPLLGTLLQIAMGAGSYRTSLEDNAEFIANDLALRSDEWLGQKVGVIERERIAR